MDVRERPAANVDAMTSLWDSSDYVLNSNSDFVCYRASGISRDRANAAMAIRGTGMTGAQVNARIYRALLERPRFNR